MPFSVLLEKVLFSYMPTLFIPKSMYILQCYECHKYYILLCFSLIRPGGYSSASLVSKWPLSVYLLEGNFPMAAFGSKKIISIFPALEMILLMNSSQFLHFLWIIKKVTRSNLWPCPAWLRGWGLILQSERSPAQFLCQGSVPGMGTCERQQISLPSPLPKN